MLMHEIVDWRIGDLVDRIPSNEAACVIYNIIAVITEKVKPAAV